MKEMGDFKKTAPKLSKIKKERPFRVPDNYFDDFSARVQTRIQTGKQTVPEKPGRIIRLLKPALGLAASFALIFVLVYWPLNEFMENLVVQNETEQTYNIDDEYLTFVESIDEDSFYALLETTETSEELSDEALIDYLSANVNDYDIYLRTEF